MKSNYTKMAFQSSGGVETVDPVIQISHTKTARYGNRNAPKVGRPIPRTFPIVALQSIILFSLYSWLIQEYNANITIQQWLGPYWKIASLFFSYNALLVVTVVLVILAVESLPGRTLAR